MTIDLGPIPDIEDIASRVDSGNAPAAGFRFEDNPLRAIGMLMQQTAAGYFGREGPLDRANAEAMQREAFRLRRVGAMFDAVRTGTEMIAENPDEADTIIGQLEQTVQLPGVGEILRALNRRGPEQANRTIGYLLQNQSVLPGLFELVEAGRITIDQAVDELEAIQGSSGNDAPAGGARQDRLQDGGIPVQAAGSEDTAPAGGYSAGAGISGGLGRLANTITDALGLGLAYPGAEEAAQALTTLQNRTMLLMTAAIPGRESDLVRERLERLTVTPASVSQADDRSRVRLSQTLQMIADEVASLDEMLASEEVEQLRSADIAAIVTNRRQLEELRTSYESVLQNWEGSPEGEALTRDERARLRALRERYGISGGSE